MSNKLVEFRSETNQTQKDVADKMEISLSFYQKIESGDRNPSYNFLCVFKKVYPNQSIEEIFFGDKTHLKCG
jgi:putative transcriptional regulator